MTEKQKGIERTTRATFFLGLLGLFLSAFALVLFYQFWKPLILGSLLALLLQKLNLRLLRYLKKDWLSSLLICVALVFMVVGPILSLVNLLVQQIRILISNLPAITATLTTYLESFAPTLAEFNIYLNQAAISQYIAERADAILSFASSTTFVQAGAWGDFMLDSIIALLTVYFVLKDGTKVKRNFTATFKMAAEPINEAFTQIATISQSIVVGTFAAAFVQALLIGAAFAISGVPGALIAWVVTFIFAFVPLLGSWPLAVVGVLYGWLQGQPSTIIIMIVGGALAGIADNVVRIWFAADGDNVHPLVILISILGGINVFGASGVVLGPLIVAVLLESHSGVTSLIFALYKKAEQSFAPQDLESKK